MGLQVRKAHLDFLALVARFDEAGRPHQRACLVAGIFMDVTGDFPEGHVRSALRLDWARAAVTGAREVKDRSAVMDPACGGKQFACGADVNIAFLVEGEVAPRERSIFSPAFIPDGNVRRDTGANQPAQELG